MSEISVEISAIFRVSEANEAIFETLSRLLEKSPKIGKYRNLDDISVEISTRGRHARGQNFVAFFGRYIADISKISAIYRRYFRYIGRYIGGLLVWLRSVVQKFDGPDHASFSNG